MTVQLSRRQLVLGCAAIPLVVPDAPTRLMRAHSHNDYEQSHPLSDALGHGFGSIEADIWLNPGGPLLVGHTKAALKPDRSLEALYLSPLSRYAGGTEWIFNSKQPLTLMIDVKTEAEATIAALHAELAKYEKLWKRWDDPKSAGTIRIVVSGNRSETAISKSPRWLAMDGRPADLDRNPAPNLVPWISDSWFSHFKWRGAETMPKDEKAKLADFVKRTHAQKRQIRFWGHPDLEPVWQVLWNAGVDYINTDNLQECDRWMRKKKA